MKKMHQIKLIHAALERDHKRYLQELAKMNLLIAKKTATIQKMQSYKKDYARDSNLTLTKSVPGLYKNLDAFIQKIDDVIKLEELEMAKVERMRASILQSLSKLDQKIKLMDIFSNRVVTEELFQENKLEQAMLDDLSGTLHLRGDHE